MRLQLFLRPFAIAIFVSVVAPARSLAKDVTVAPDGSGDFKSVKEAVDAVPAGNAERVVITVKPGTYKDRFLIGKDKPFITLLGEDPKTTVLTWDWNAKTLGPDGKPVGTSGSYSVRVEAGDFVAQNITFENTAGDNGQALALYASGDRQVYRNCRFIGWQDTLYAGQGRQYYVDCYVEGRVDFIFGHATAVFERCTIHSKNGGFVTAADTRQDQPFGYVFLDCKLTGEGKPALLGRPWRPHAAVAFIRCEMGPHIDPVGWDNWRNAENEKTARYGEHACTGPGADRSKRAAWSRELSADEAGRYTAQNVLAGADAWNPAATK